MAYTAFIKQYLSLKKSLPDDCLLLFRLGDFYEFFFEDARIAAGLLDLVLTSREGGQGKVPMCGIPFHALQGYVRRLVQAGKKVAICEQVEDPKKAQGLVRREVVRIVTPSTYVEDEGPNGKDFRYLAALARLPKIWGLAFLEPTTGAFSLSEHSSLEEVQTELARLNPTELLLPRSVEEEGLLQLLLDSTGGKPCTPTVYEDWQCEVGSAREAVLSTYGLGSLKGLGLDPYTAGLAAVGMILQYLKENFPGVSLSLLPPKPCLSQDFLFMDPASERSLELFPTNPEDKEKRSLLAVLDETLTPMGGRLLRQWLKRPLLSPSAIRERQGAISAWVSDPQALYTTRQLLGPVRDLERLASRVSYGVANPRDLALLCLSLEQAPLLKAHLRQHSPSLIRKQEGCIQDFSKLCSLLKAALVDDPPPHLRSGGVIREGFHPRLDELRTLSSEAKHLIAGLQKRERERTGIKSLKVGYSKVFGYFIEVSQAHLGQVPQDYVRKQTLSQAERFVTPELKEYEDKILHAEERSRALEEELFGEICRQVQKELPSIRETAEAIAHVDVLSSLALIALQRNYVCPEVDESTKIEISGGRHPVVEEALGAGRFVENDCFLDRARHQFLLLTGPNMAGKSCYLRQVALIVLLAQVGSFVPASQARIGIVDRLFTRIGASDNLARGESTFMVEMLEVARMLHHATPRSLVLLDEVGRGTSTLDGMSIARAIVEYLTDPEGPRPRTLFATHYHELTDMADRIPGMQNLCTAVREVGKEVVFLYKMRPGTTDKSYGLHVAKLAGLPQAVVERAREILATLEQEQKRSFPRPRSLAHRSPAPQKEQLPLFTLPRED